MHFNIVLPSVLRSPEWSLSFGNNNNNSNHSTPQQRATEALEEDINVALNSISNVFSLKLLWALGTRSDPRSWRGYPVICCKNVVVVVVVMM
jgi:hypothetical protein